MAEINWRTLDECVPRLRFAPQVIGWMVHCLWPWNAADCTAIMCRSSRLIRWPSAELRVDQLDATCKNLSSDYILLRGGQPVSVCCSSGMEARAIWLALSAGLPTSAHRHIGTSAPRWWACALGFGFQKWISTPFNRQWANMLAILARCHIDKHFDPTSAFPANSVRSAKIRLGQLCVSLHHLHLSIYIYPWHWTSSLARSIDIETLTRWNEPANLISGVIHLNWTLSLGSTVV